MPIETIIPTDEAHWLSLRRADVTSTEVAALFNCSPYMTAFELWHRKHDNLEVAFETNERMKWGTRLQDSIANGIAEDKGWVVRRMTEYIRDTDSRIGASFDFSICHHKTDGLGTAIEGQENEDGILEIKNVDSLAFRDGWAVDGDNIEAPVHIELQVQHQLLLSGRLFCKIGALVGGNRVILITREPDQAVFMAIKKKVAEFWQSVAEHREPKPDFARDAETIGRIYAFAEPGKIFNADEAVAKLAFEYKRALELESAAKKQKEAAKAEILTLVGSAEKILGETFTISAGMQGPVLIEAYERKGFRNFRINWKKEKLNG